MIIQTFFTAQAEAAAERYGLLVEGWRGLYAQALDASTFGTPKALSDIVEAAYSLSRPYIDTERRMIADAFDAVSREALETTGHELGYRDAVSVPAALSDHLSESESYLMHELLVQIERDVLFLKASLQRATLQVTLAARARDMPLRLALLQYRIGNATELHFFFHDRRGQKWPSRKFVRAVWRHALLTAYNETALLVLADHGRAEASIRHLNPQADSHGMVLAMASNSELPVYSEVRNEIFHPNSDAIITAELPA